MNFFADIYIFFEYIPLSFQFLQLLFPLLFIQLNRTSAEIRLKSFGLCVLSKIKNIYEKKRKVKHTRVGAKKAQCERIFWCLVYASLTRYHSGFSSWMIFISLTRSCTLRDSWLDFNLMLLEKIISIF